MPNKPINLIKKLYIFRVRGGIEGAAHTIMLLLANAIFTYNRAEQDTLIFKTLKSDLKINNDTKIINNFLFFYIENFFTYFFLK